RLQQLGRLEQLEPTNYSYEAFSDIEDAIFYLDPPYENTTQKSYKGDFNSQAFYDWAFGMSKNNIVLISSYDISDERFECVYEFKTARSTMQGGGAGKRTEKLFMAVIT
ncbi:TPA: DNA adenine methylase, partial [Streptococcus pyogenes]|nr:DNA adenine methylase [Streptococcus pyogenes]